MPIERPHARVIGTLRATSFLPARVHPLCLALIEAERAAFEDLYGTEINPMCRTHLAPDHTGFAFIMDRVFGRSERERCQREYQLSAWENEGGSQPPPSQQLPCPFLRCDRCSSAYFAGDGYSMVRGFSGWEFKTGERWCASCARNWS